MKRFSYSWQANLLKISLGVFVGIDLAIMFLLCCFSIGTCLIAPADEPVQIGGKATMEEGQGKALKSLPDSIVFNQESEMPNNYEIGSFKGEFWIQERSKISSLEGVLPGSVLTTETVNHNLPVVKINDQFPLFGEVYRVSKLAYRQVAFERVKDPAVLKELDVKSDSLCILKGERVSFGERGSPNLILKEITTLSNGTRQAHFEELERQTEQEFDAIPEGNVSIYGHKFTVRKIVIPDESRHIPGWVELSVKKDR